MYGLSVSCRTAISSGDHDRKAAWPRGCPAATGLARASAASQQEAQDTGTYVSILCRFAVPFGCSLKLVGNHPALGAWDIAAAPALDWNEGHVWRGAVRLPRGDHEFKCVVVDSNGNPREWEQGQNRSIPVKGGISSLSLDCSWGSPTQVEEHWDAVSDAAPGATELDHSHGITEAGDQAGASESQQQPGRSAYDEALEQASKDGVLGADKESDGQAYDASSAIVGPASGEDESSAEAEIQSQAAAGGAPTAEEDAASDDKAYDASSVMVEPTSVPNEPETQSRSQREGSEASASQPSQPFQVAEQAKEGWREAGAASTSQGQVPAWLSAVGLAALPLVAWSQYSLFQTGCGLPPGPSGSLGAAEGVSYLSVLGLACWGLYIRTAARRAASAGWQSLVEAASASLVVSGLAVLGYQVQARGYVPAALPDSRCHGRGAPSSNSNVLGGLASAPPLSSAAETVQGLAGQLAQVSGSALSSADLEGTVRGVREAGRGLVDAAQNQLQGVSNGFRGFMSLQQEQQAQLQAGAADGLSAADISAVVDEAGAVAQGLKRSLGQLLHSFASPAAALPPSPARPLGGPGRPLPQVPLAALPLPVSLLSNWAPCGYDEQDGDGLPVVSVSFGAAATTAVTAANNVTVNINTAVMQLQATVDSVRNLLSEATSLAQQEHVDLTQVTDQLDLLQQALCSAKHATEGLHLQPLVLQLSEAAESLRRSKAPDDGAVADDLSARLENAAASLSRAADMADPLEIEAARLHIIHTFPPGTYFTASNAKSPPKQQLASSPAPDATVDRASLAPAVQATEKAAEQLQAVVEELHDADASLAPLENDSLPKDEH